MPDLPVVSIGRDGRLGDGDATPPAGPWVGALGTGPADRRASLLAVAARARGVDLIVARIDAGDGDPHATLAALVLAPPGRRPQGLLLGEAWQEAAAARCATLTGAAAELGLADAIRGDDPDAWQGHHLVAGAAEAFLAQIWPDSYGPIPRAVVLGAGPMGLAAALIAARRGAGTVTLVVTDPGSRDDVVARLASDVDWPPTVTWQVNAGRDPEAPITGLWVRASDRPVADDLWLPDAAGGDPCVVIDLAGATVAVPLGFAHPAAGGVQVMAAGLAAAWYLGPPVPWDALTAASST